MARQPPDDIFSAISFPCGAMARNRLVKAPMYEHLAQFLGGPPNEYHFALYDMWSRYEWGMVITGNVQVSNQHLSLGRDIVVPKRLDDASLRPFRTLSKVMRGREGNTLAIMQLSHSGRQSTNFLGGRLPFKKPLAPSAVRLGENIDMGDPIATLARQVLFQTPKEMSIQDIDKVVESFVQGARLAHEAGFDGIELHVAHGYLLAQFLSPKVNKRHDEYSVHSENGLCLLHRIINAIRAIVPEKFIVGVKLNASDYLPESTNDNKSEASLDPEEKCAIGHIIDFAKWETVDFVDISGGNYENPEFMMTGGSKKGQRQAFFSRFSQNAIKALDKAGFCSHHHRRPVIMLTGGLQTPNLLHSALRSGQTDMLGIGRASVTCPNIPEIMHHFNTKKKQLYENDCDEDGDKPFAIEPDLSTPTFLEIWPLSSIWKSLSKVKLVGAGINMAWYTLMIRRLALAVLNQKSLETDSKLDVDVLEMGKPDYSIGGLEAVLKVFCWRLAKQKGKRPRTSYVGTMLILGLFLLLGLAYYYWYFYSF